MNKTFLWTPGKLRLSEVEQFYFSEQSIGLDKAQRARVDAAQQVIAATLKKQKIVYGVNTGFGKLAREKIPADKLKALQKNLILSHATGTGPLLPADCVRLIFLLKVNGLLQGYSGIRFETIEHLVKILNAGILPCIPAKGSVGASGDLAPLAHMACALIGEGEVFFQNQRIPSLAALQKIGLSPLVLEPKEGLALLNGTQVTAALAVEAIFKMQTLFDAALVAGALSLVALQGDTKTLDERIHRIRGLKGGEEVAAALAELIQGSVNSSARVARVQDPYSLRCQGQVMGACLEQLRSSAALIQADVNAITDNPLIFSQTEEILTGGNFHAQSLAFAADAMANVIATIGNMSERRIALFMDASMSGLPDFLVRHSGVNSGFMLAHVTAAALASENKTLAHPASVDTIPTSGNQEDHVSMATFAARRLGEMLENTSTIVAIELLAACQGIDFHDSLFLSPPLKLVYEKIRYSVPFYETDRYFYPDIEQTKKLLWDREFVLPRQIGSNRCALYE